MTDTPQLLLQHHLKKLKLPTFQGEYDKLAQQCVAEGKDHVPYLLRLVAPRRLRRRQLRALGSIIDLEEPAERDQRDGH